jgi:hypothetical protein
MKIQALALLQLTLVSLVGLVSNQTFADNSVQSSSQASEPESKLWFFLGTDVGYTHLSTNALGESNLRGSQTDVKGLLSYYTEKWVFDGGVGWFFNHLAGNESSGPATTNSRSLFAEIDAIYRLKGGHWRFGPVLNFTLGSGMNLSPVSPDSTTFVALGGLQVDYEVNPEDQKWRFRLIARAINSIGLQERNLFVAQGGFQIGLPLTPAPAAITH